MQTVPQGHPSNTIWYLESVFPESWLPLYQLGAALGSFYHWDHGGDHFWTAPSGRWPGLREGRVCCCLSRCDDLGWFLNQGLLYSCPSSLLHVCFSPLSGFYKLRLLSLMGDSAWLGATLSIWNSNIFCVSSVKPVLGDNSRKSNKESFREESIRTDDCYSLS